ncbi:hypothetical protein NAF17_06485 [Mucilaginibacter sp. RB4R14]|uniref:hypothetical protein n=1 Tax=Mucilaginibacter aurantiaciroseus TaxID=2949308 RepID=UPI00209174CF|nr:hypothetical protein [Mucilaginibacter aurantiaciroseus]MCO5935180.1 hypothetical protein [Mucilaginibacter aurantiaciroseus]
MEPELVSFFNFLLDDATGNHNPVVITNKHVVVGAQTGKLFFTKASETREPLDTEHYELVQNNFESLWVMHPNNSFDLFAIPITFYQIEAEENGIKLFYKSLGNKLIPKVPPTC